MQKGSRAWLVAGALALVVGAMTSWAIAGGAVAPGDGEVDTSVEPLPDSARATVEAMWSEIDRRVSDWSAREGILQMNTEELVSGMDALTNAINRLEPSPDWGLTVRELAHKRGQLCLLLPEGHPYGVGEYC